MRLDQSPAMPALSGGWRYCVLCEYTQEVIFSHTHFFVLFLIYGFKHVEITIPFRKRFYSLIYRSKNVQKLFVVKTIWEYNVAHTAAGHCQSWAQNLFLLFVAHKGWKHILYHLPRMELRLCVCCVLLKREN